MKTTGFIILSFLLPFSILAQLTRSIPDIEQKKQPVTEIVQNQLYTAARGDVFQDFESFSDFSLVFSPWTTRDVDGSLTYGITGFTFPHSGEAMSFIVFNPSQTTPSLLDDAAILPHTGERFAACFASQLHANDDWLISPKIELGANGFIKFWVKSYTSAYGLERYRVGVSTTNTEPSSFTIISDGSYLEAPADAWQQKQFDLSAYEGQDVYIGIHCVSRDAFIFMVDDIEIISQPVATSTLTGKVSDAVTGAPIANALVSVAGLSAYSDESGNYVIDNVPYGALTANFNADVTTGNAPLIVHFTDLSTEGTHTVTASAEGYTDYSNNQVIIPAGGLFELQIALSPALQEGQYRFVLTWGETPADLDAHLLTPIIGDSAYHIYYDQQGSDTVPPFAVLDIDDQFGFGPETITIYELKEGEYRFYVHNYTGSPALIASNAVVQIFGADGLLQTLQVPVSGTGQYWDICTLNGANGKISLFNQITSVQPGGTKLLPAKSPSENQALTNRNIISWSWNFGDGGTSTMQNPIHNYSTIGTYTVSLTVSDYFTSNTKTRTAYIQAGPIGVGENDRKPRLVVYPNPLRDEFRIITGYEMRSVSIFDLSGRLLFKEEINGTEHSIKSFNVTEGQYILRIETSEGTLQRKITVIN